MDKFRAVTFFCRTTEAGSFAAAAASLDLVPSALSKAIAALEQDLGVTLFTRTTRRLSLTAEGQAYYRRCRDVLRALEEADGVARRDTVRPRGPLRVGIHPALRALLFPELRRLLDAHPELRVETFITNSPMAVVDHDLDVVLCIGRLADSTLKARRLGWARSIVCAAPGYLRRWGEPRRPEDLAQHHAIVYARPDEEPNLRWQFVRGSERAVVAVPVRMIVRDGIGLVDAGLGGGGVLRPYEPSARRHVAAGALKVLLAEWSTERQPIYGVFPRMRHVSAKVRLFLDFAESLLRVP